MSNLDNDQVQQRIKKLQNLEEQNINAYGKAFANHQSTTQVKASFNEDEEQFCKVAGRIMTFRDMGKSIFATLKDEVGTIQLFASKNTFSEEDFLIFKKLDIGDIIGVEGKLFITKKGEITVREFKFTILSKAIRPLPEKFHGLTNIESRYRQRYLDLIANEQSLQTFRLRSKIISGIRNYLEEKGYLEVETPMMHPIAGGAAAKPFTTHYNALNQKMYLRIATELYLKKLLVGGLEKIFELNRNFRNEGLSKQHNPEFTALEVYQAYGDYETMMILIEDLIRHLAKTILNTTLIKHSEEKTINLEAPFKKITFHDIIKERIHQDWFNLSIEEQRKIASSLNCHTTADMDCIAISQEIYEKTIEPTLIQPTFITHLPYTFVPLAKRNEQNKELVDVYELVIDGKEISPGYSELNDPFEQRKRLELQRELTLGTQDEESGTIDEDFLLALEHGMPPAGGLGLGIDRLVMLLCSASNIKDVILFPQLKN